MLDVKQPKILMFDVIEGKILVFSVFEIPPSRPSNNIIASSSRQFHAGIFIFRSTRTVIR